MVSDPARSRARRIQLSWLGVAGTIVAVSVATLLANRTGSFIDLTYALVAAIVGWYLAAALISTGLVWWRSRSVGAVVVFNLIGIAAPPVLTAAGFWVVPSVQGAWAERTHQKQASYGRVTRWRLNKIAEHKWVLDGDFDSGFTGKLRFEFFDGNKSDDLQVTEGQSLAFVVGPLAGGGSTIGSGFRLYFDGVLRQIYMARGEGEHLERGVLRRVLPARDPSDSELEDEEKHRAEACVETVQPGTIRFRVTGTNQKGRFAGATLRASGCGRELSATSDADGFASFVVPPGEYRLSGAVVDEEAARVGDPARVRSGETYTIDYGMPGPVPEGIRGRLLMEWGPNEAELLKSNRLTLRGERGELFDTTTDAVGGFELRLPAGRYSLEAELKGRVLRQPVTLTYGWKELGDVRLIQAR